MFAACATLALGACAVDASGSQAAVALQGVVPTDYAYAVSWDPDERVLDGVGTIDVENRGPKPVRDVWLRLRPNNRDGLVRVTFVKFAKIVSRRAGGSMLKLRLDGELRAGERDAFLIEFRARVPRDQTSLGRSAGIDLFGDVLPVIAVTGSDQPRIGPEPSYGEGSLNPVAKWSVGVTVPRGLRAVLPGREARVSRSRKTTTYESEADVRDYAFAVGRYTSRSKRVNGVKLTVVGSAEKKRELGAALRRTVNAFSKLQQWYGGYKLPSLKVVIGDLPFGGSEYPGIVFSTVDNATISHEVAHQWFYGLVGNDQYKDPFLDESLTAFSEQRFHKSYRCNLARPINGRHGLATGMDYWEKHARAYEDTIYRGGACALTLLRHDLGASVFDRALRSYVAANANKIASTDDFLAAIRNAAPNYDLARWQRLVGL
ncbi:MAG: hypothetical protein JHC98_11830 [Thermoleophilaceae bacterium]|nr:hypothetical protein [Thermoleophilaceae bacterium]